MYKADVAFAVDDGIHGHAPKFEQVDFLFVEFGNSFSDIGHADKRNVVLAPVIDK